MLRNPRWSMEELGTWARWGHAAERISDLLRPHDFLWPESVSSLESLFPLVQCAYGARLTAQALAGSALAQRERAPAWAATWCEDHLSLADLGLPLDWRTAASIPWTMVPLALAGPTFGRICWCLVGMLPSGLPVRSVPDWWDVVTDAETRQAVADLMGMLDRAEGIRVFFWPFLVSPETVQLCGPSLALPLYLASWGLKRMVQPKGLLATGIMDDSGRLQPTGHLETKAALAMREGFRALMAPASEKLCFPSSERFEMLTVSTLEEATFLWEGYASGNGSSLLQQIRSIGEPEWTAAGAHLLRHEMLGLPGLMNRYAQSLETVLAKRDLVIPWINNLERMVDNPHACLHTLRDLLQPLEPSRVLSFAKRFPMDGFRLAQIQLSCANHCGNPEAASEWLAVCRQLEPSLAAYAETLMVTADRANRQLVAERHNRYVFSASIPEELAAVLADLRELHAVSRRRSPGAVCEPLGRLYGTLAQNFGFCGPAHLASVREMVEMAQQAFGGGRVPELRDDWQRQFSTLLYAFLDAGDYDEATSALADYLGRPLAAIESAACIEDLNPYQHAALARYLVDADVAAPAYLAWAIRKRDAVFRRHPWQLWAANIADLATDPEDKIRMGVKSIECCLAQGPTVQVMALMPLSRLRSLDRVSGEWINATVQRVISLLRGSSLHVHHFQELLDKDDPAELLDCVAAFRTRLFPFSYR